MIERRGEIEAALRAAKEKGTNRITWFLLADGRGAPTFDNYGAAGLDDRLWADYDVAIDLARTLDVGILWVLIDRFWFFPDRTETGKTAGLSTSRVERP